MLDRPTRVLIVVDSETDRVTFRFFLDQQRLNTYSIQEAASGVEALAACQTFVPDCILLDHGLPDTDGLDLLTAIREKFGRDGMGGRVSYRIR